MVDFNIVPKLMKSFPRSIINSAFEFVAHMDANEYFRLENCETELDVKCKVIEWLSRGAHKTAPFGERKNREFHKFMLDGINNFLGTSFMPDDMGLIYTYLGNACDHEKTIRFVESGYDMKILKERENG